jgi:ABC-type lipopolysaccharide export system ATPase subunit
MALEKQLLLGLVQPNSGNIYDDLNITDYNVQRAQQEIGYLAKAVFRKLSIETIS